MKHFTCIVETPRGSGGKVNFEPALGCFKLGKTLPAGLVFPFDFGFIPGTVGEDGDPLDVIIISEIQSFPGCALDCRIIGALKAHQTEQNGERVRNDRYLAIPEISVLHQQVTQLRQLPRQIIEEIEEFFVNYNEQAAKRFEPLEKRSATEAQKAIQKAQSAAKPNHLIQLVLPLNDERGDPFPQKHYTAIQQKLIGKFGGATLYTRSPASGLWKDEDNQLVRDQVIVFEVMVPLIDTDFWKEYRQSLEKTFTQDQIIIRRLETGLL